METEIILGPPGTGKTTALLNIVDSLLRDGVPPAEIAYVSFTRKATAEAMERAQNKFDLTKNDLPYFRTIHSMCYKELGIIKDEVMQTQHYQELGEILGVDFTGYYSIEEGLPTGTNEGDKLLFIDSYARATLQTLAQVQYELDSEYTLQHLELFRNTQIKYKLDKGLIDFTDMLMQFVAYNKVAPVKVAIIDEAQDLCALQWEVIRVAFGQCVKIFIAGDDDQCIYKWSGADSRQFMAIKGPRIVLNKSYRLPRLIWVLGNAITTTISTRIKKEWQPRDDEGSITWYSTPEDVDLSEGSWLLLARNNYMLKRLEYMAQDAGLLYATKKGPSVKTEHATVIRSWETLRRGLQLPVAAIQTVYSHLEIGKSIERGALRKLKVLKDTMRLDIEELLLDYGLLTEDVWHDVLTGIGLRDLAYYRAVLQNGGTLFAAPRIMISTIHGVKGGEADNVLLMTDISHSCYQSMQRNPDDEARVFYVGVTRARESLHIIEPQGNYFYNLS